MSDALYIAATGMQAHQASIDAIAKNTVNLETPLYKRQRVNFEELVTGGGPAAPAADLQAGITSQSAHLGAGVGVQQVLRSFEAGELKRTEGALDLAIAGAGFIEATMADGSVVYARGGALHIDEDRRLALAGGATLKPEIRLPDDLQSLSFTADGRVLAQVAQRAAPVELGKLELVQFNNPEALSMVADNLYAATAASGEPLTVLPDAIGAPTLQQGFLESSNVKIVDEMVNLMVARRAYEASVKVVQADDEMMGLVNNLRK